MARPVNSIVPTPEEVIRIIDNLPERLKVLVRFFAETGCRRGEALNLKWECVDEIGGYAEIMSRDGWTPKTQQSERRIPLNPPLLDALRSLPKVGEYVFPGKVPGKPIHTFKKSWVTAVREAKIVRNGKPVHLPIRSLRMAHATWQAERGTHETVLQGLLGHAKGSDVTKRFYVQVSEEAKRQAMLSLPFAVNTN
jgi:integrase